MRARERGDGRSVIIARGERERESAYRRQRGPAAAWGTEEHRRGLGSVDVHGWRVTEDQR